MIHQECIIGYSTQAASSPDRATVPSPSRPGYASSPPPATSWSACRAAHGPGATPRTRRSLSCRGPLPPYRPGRHGPVPEAVDALIAWQVPPGAAIRDRPDGLGADPEDNGQLTRRDALGPEPADLVDADFVELGVRVRPPGPPAVEERVVAVGLGGVPPQVREDAIRSVTVPMVGHHPLGTWSVERLQDDPVDAASCLLAAPGQIRRGIAKAEYAPQCQPGVGHDGRASVAAPARLDLSVFANAISGVAVDGPEIVVHALSR